MHRVPEVLCFMLAEVAGGRCGCCPAGVLELNPCCGGTPASEPGILTSGLWSNGTGFQWVANDFV